MRNRLLTALAAVMLVLGIPGSAHAAPPSQQQLTYTDQDDYNAPLPSGCYDVRGAPYGNSSIRYAIADADVKVSEPTVTHSGPVATPLTPDTYTFTYTYPSGTITSTFDLGAPSCRGAIYQLTVLSSDGRTPLGFNLDPAIKGWTVTRSGTGTIATVSVPGDGKSSVIVISGTIGADYNNNNSSSVRSSSVTWNGTGPTPTAADALAANPPSSTLKASGATIDPYGTTWDPIPNSGIPEDVPSGPPGGGWY